MDKLSLLLVSAMPPAPKRVDAPALLSRIPIFKGFHEGSLLRLAAGSREIRSLRGETLFRKDEPCNGLYLVVYGRVKLVFLSPLGGEKTLEILEQGQTFCESTMFLEKSYSVFAHTLTDCLLLHVDKDVIFTELENDASFARRLIRSLAQQLSDRTADIEAYLLQSGRQRIINYLLRALAEGSTGFEGEANSPQVTLPATKGVIASRLNLTQEHFSRVLHELVHCGLVAVNGRHIHIPDVAQLRLSAAA